jgi:peptidoglycan/xylan/chitin deacetylase (PgdA/CDA1 family)
MTARRLLTGSAEAAIAGGSVRPIARAFWPAVGSIVPIRWFQALTTVPLLVPYYHVVSDERLPHVHHLYRYRSVREFEADLEFLRRNFVPVHLSEIVAALNGGPALPARSFHLTFDDGFREMHDVVAPTLLRIGIPATFFVNTASLDNAQLIHHNALSVVVDRVTRSASVSVQAAVRERLGLPAGSAELPRTLLALPYRKRSMVNEVAHILGVSLHQYVLQHRPYLSSDQVRSLLSRGFTVGAHSHDHPLYADLPLEDQLAQTRRSTEILVERFGISPRAFAFPHTDRGVGPEFFAQLFSAQALDVSFGTAGLSPHWYPRNIERVAMENTRRSAAQVLTWQYVRAAHRTWVRTR